MSLSACPSLAYRVTPDAIGAALLYAAALFTGIPLLDYFGGTGDWPAGIGDGQEELTELMRLIDAVLDEP